LIIPDSATEKPSKGEILAIGNGKINDNGDVIALDVKVGDQVLFGQYAGNEIKVDGETLLVVREDDIVAIIE
ncbi:co-chaperone GroES, partial [Solemya elarraichensis gill symbiont]